LDEKEKDKDFDYDLYEIKYGIDLRSEPLEEKQPEPEETETETEKKPASETARKAPDQGKMELYDWLQCIVSAILCGILIFVFVGRVIGVEGTSMLDTLYDRDKIIMSNFLYKPKYGDIVVLKAPNFTEKPLVKRVIATEGQTLDIDFSTGKVYIDGREIKEDYIREPTLTQLDFEGPVTIPEGYVFVMGDNRNASSDSRHSLVGFVDKRQILGKVLFVLIPGPGMDGTRDWSRIGSPY
jgi:signal peptidase I